MFTVAEHSRKDTDMRRSIAVSIQGRNMAIRIGVVYGAGTSLKENY